MPDTTLAAAIDMLRRERDRHVDIVARLDTALAALGADFGGENMPGVIPVEYSSPAELAPSVDSGAAVYPCPDCGKSAKSKSGLAAHRRSHFLAKPRSKKSPAAEASTATLQCPRCSKSFKFANGLSRHLNETHGQPSSARARTQPAAPAAAAAAAPTPPPPDPDDNVRPIARPAPLPSPEQAHRTCATCDVRLSQYNKGDYCGSCERDARSRGVI